MSGWSAQQLVEYLEPVLGLYSAETRQRFILGDLIGKDFIDFGHADGIGFFLQVMLLPPGMARRLCDEVAKICGNSVKSKTCIFIRSGHEGEVLTYSTGSSDELEENPEPEPKRVHTTDQRFKDLKAEARHLLSRIRGLKLSPTDLSNPAFSQVLPFPSIGFSLPTDRFRLSAQRDWTYFGREMFEVLEEKVRELMEAPVAGLWLYGTIGYGIFNSFKRWTEEFHTAGIAIGPVTFLWITDGAPSVVSKERTDRGMRSEIMELNPGYVSKRLSLKDVDYKISQRYAIALEQKAKKSAKCN